MPTPVVSPESTSARCFFFQAEDGIRDLTVTGVQTCALPISNLRVIAEFCAWHGSCTEDGSRPNGGTATARAEGGSPRIMRSEERRGGKECRSWWSPYHLKKKKLTIVVEY